MSDASRLLDAVERAFAATGVDLTGWPDPHPDRSVPGAAYSRLTNPARWRILGARTDAWLLALAAAGVAAVERDTEVSWRQPPGPVISRSERAVPGAPGAIQLVVAHSRLGDVDDAGIVLGVAHPTEVVNVFPDCGCDACDSGSRDELDHLDAHVLAIVTGGFRRLTAGPRTITVLDDESWSASNVGRRQVMAAIADPRGWREVSGRSWLP